MRHKDLIFILITQIIFHAFGISLNAEVEVTHEPIIACVDHEGKVHFSIKFRLSELSR